MIANQVIELLRKHKVKIENPLTDKEIEVIQDIYGIEFPPDLLDLYLCGLPVGNNFPNWRDTSDANKKTINDKLEWPLEGMLFDIEHNSFWYAQWGDKPSELEEAFSICKDRFKAVPRLVPIYSHRYIPSIPHESGNPIFSVYQTDIIYYGEDLKEYFNVEFDVKQHEEINYDLIKRIEFWSDLVE